MIKFITGISGSGKSTRLMEYINELSEQKKELCIIVPEQFSYEFDKNLYYHIGAVKFNQLFSLTFTSLARQLFQLYGDINRNGIYADNLSKIIIMQEALINISKAPDGFRELKKHSKKQGFISDILKLVSDLKKANITPLKLNEKSMLLNGRLCKKANDISDIYMEYEKLLKSYGLKDNLNDISEAAKIAAYNQYFKNKTVFIDEFESFTGDQYELLKVMISDADDIYICFRTEDVNAGEFTLFETVNRTYKHLTSICRELHTDYSNEICDGSFRYNSEDLSFLNKNILRNKTADCKCTSDNISIFECSDYYSECEYVCAAVKRLIHDNNFKYNDICIISNKIQEYAGLLESTFKRYEIPYFLSLEKSVSHTSLMVFISSLIDILVSKAYNSDMIFRLVKCELLDISLTEISLLENYCYKWSINGSKWNKPFSADTDEAKEAEIIREKIIAPLEELKNKCNDCNVKTVCSEIYNYIIKMGTDKKIASIMGDFIQENKDYFASEQKRIWGFLMDILDSLNSIIGDKVISISEFSLLFKTLLAQIQFSVPPQTLDSVTVASAQTARLNSPKVVFVIGANEGDFPNSINMHGLLSEEEKLKLSEIGLDISRSAVSLIADERLIVYKSLSVASDKLYITYPLSDLSGQVKYPAQIIKSLIGLFENGSKLRITENEVQPHFYAVTKQSAFYHFMQSQKNNSNSVMSVKALLENDEEYRSKIEFVYSQYNFNGEHFVNDKEMLERLKSFVPLRLSPTKFECYNGCHFKYFCSECLKIVQRERVELNPVYTGNIIHSCFNHLLAENNKNKFVSMSIEEIRHRVSECACNYRKKNMGGDFDATPRFEMNFEKFTNQITKVAAHLQQELMISDFTPVQFEYNLRTSKPLALNFANEKSLEFGGIVDRIDTCTINDKKYIRIVDYKSSKKYLDPISLNNGINMQMLLYLFTLTENNNIFSGYSPAGVMYSPVTINAPVADDTRNETENSTHINSSLKTSGLLINDDSVLNAMENGISGKYIPVKVSKSKKTDKNSACISEDSFSRLRDFSYKKLTETAELIYSGNFEANPLVTSSFDACAFCDYSGICGINNKNTSRNGTENDMNEIHQILEEEKEKE